MKAIFIIGPSGSGKTTLSKTLQEHYQLYFGGDSTISINLDCANVTNKEVDICKLINLEQIMEQLQLGPNGSLLYSIDFLWQNLQWLYTQIQSILDKKDPSFSIIKKLQQNKKVVEGQLQLSNTILLFDLPGQIELFLNNDSLRNIIMAIIKKYKLSVCILEIFDATYIYSTSDFVSMSMISLNTIFNLELPHISLLNKIDLLKGQRPADGMLQGYTGLSSLKQMVKDHLFISTTDDDILTAVSSIVDQFSLVSFLPCSIYKPDLISFLILQLQKIFGTLQSNLLGSKAFMSAVKDHIGDFGGHHMLNNLQGELFSEEESEDFGLMLQNIKKSLG